jgi:hypothetical protein
MNKFLLCALTLVVVGLIGAGLLFAQGGGQKAAPAGAAAAPPAGVPAAAPAGVPAGVPAGAAAKAPAGVPAGAAPTAGAQDTMQGGQRSGRGSGGRGGQFGGFQAQTMADMTKSVFDQLALDAKGQPTKTVDEEQWLRARKEAWIALCKAAGKENAKSLSAEDFAKAVETSGIQVLFVGTPNQSGSLNRDNVQGFINQLDPNAVQGVLNAVQGALQNRGINQGGQFGQPGQFGPSGQFGQPAPGGQPNQTNPQPPAGVPGAAAPPAGVPGATAPKSAAKQN